MYRMVQEIWQILKYNRKLNNFCIEVCCRLKCFSQWKLFIKGSEIVPNFIYKLRCNLLSERTRKFQNIRNSSTSVKDHSFVTSAYRAFIFCNVYILCSSNKKFFFCNCMFYNKWCTAKCIKFLVLLSNTLRCRAMYACIMKVLKI